jgi:hypothetical protein
MTAWSAFIWGLGEGLDLRGIGRYLYSKVAIPYVSTILWVETCRGRVGEGTETWLFARLEQTQVGA